MEQSFSIEQHEEMRQQIDDVRLASFLTRASIAAHAVCDGHKNNLVGRALDKLKEQRDHWIKEVNSVATD